MQLDWGGKGEAGWAGQSLRDLWRCPMEYRVQSGLQTRLSPERGLHWINRKYGVQLFGSVQELESGGYR
jgi:hypothetical protein